MILSTAIPSFRPSPTAPNLTTDEIETLLRGKPDDNQAYSLRYRTKLHLEGTSLGLTSQQLSDAAQKILGQNPHTRIDLTDYQEKRRASSLASQQRQAELLAANPMKRYETALVEEHMAQAHLVAAGSRFIGKAIEEAITNTSSLVCDNNPIMRDLCDNTKSSMTEGLVAALTVTGLKDPILKDLEALDRHHKQFPPHLEPYGIDPQTAEQYVRDTTEIGLMMIPFVGSVGRKGVNGVIKSVSKPSRPQRFSSLRFPTQAEVPKVMQKIESAYQFAALTEPNERARFVLEEFANIITSSLPPASIAISKEEAWRAAVKGPLGTGLQSASYFEKGLEEAWRTNIQSKIWAGLEAPVTSLGKYTDRIGPIVIKSGQFEEVIQGVAGGEFLRSLQIRGLSVPVPIALGEYKGDFFLAESHLQGKSLEYRIQKIGTESIGSEKRNYEFSALLQAVEKAGQVIGQLQKKSSSPPIREFASSGQKAFEISTLAERLEEINGYLPSMHLRRIPDSLNNNLIRNFKTAPIPMSYGLGYTFLSNFIWGPTSALGFTGAEWTTNTFTANRSPNIFSMSEYHDFLSELQSVGLRKGLTLEEISLCNQAFDKGWHLKYTGPVSPEANAFASVSNKSKTIYDLVDEELTPLQHQELEKLVTEVSSQMRSSRF